VEERPGPREGSQITAVAGPARMSGRTPESEPGGDAGGRVRHYHRVAMTPEQR
jgi:hypothetical protein